MIVVSSNAALALQSTGNADFPVIGWHNVVTAGNVAAESEDADFPASNLGNPSTAPQQGWRSDSLDEQLVTVSPIAIDSEIDYVGIARHNFGSGLISVAVEATLDGVDWDVVLDATLLGDDSPAILRFVPDFYTGIRLRLVPDAVVPRACVVYVGRLLQMERGVQPGAPPMPFARQRNAMTGRSQAGDFLGRIVVGGKLASSVEIKALTPDWYRANLDQFFEASADLPFFWAWKPETYPREVAFAWLTADPQPQVSHLAGYIDISLQMEGIVA